jgi:hypothetical protein
MGAPDSATYFTLQPGVSVTIPASIITVIPGAQIPGDNVTVQPSPPVTAAPPTPPTGLIFPPPPSTVAPTVPIPVPLPDPSVPTPLPIPTPLPAPIGGDPERACAQGDAPICPAELAPNALNEADVRLSLQLQTASANAAAVTGTAINFGRVHDRVCLAGVKVTLPFDREVTNPTTNEKTIAPSSEFVIECVFIGVRERSGPPSDNFNGCNVYASATMSDDGVELTFANVALCKECWIVGGPAGLLFTVRHRDNLLLALPVLGTPTAAAQVLTESAATCASTL